MALKKKPVTGMKDMLPREMEIRDYLIGLIKETYKTYGFCSIETPCVEHIENLCSKQGGDNEKLIFKILKRGEKLKIDTAKEENDLVDGGLRYDLTVPLARYYANHSNELPAPFKALQIGNVWRADRPQKGRFRQFMQCDIDILGEPGNLAEIELILATTAMLGKLSFQNFTVCINDRNILKAMAAYSGFREDDYDEVFIILDKMDKIGAEGVAKELEEMGYVKENVETYLQLFKDVAPDVTGIRFLKEKLGDCLSEETADSMEMIISSVETAKECEFNIKFDPTLVRGQSYYTGTIFEVTMDDFGGSVAGGGRYDKMIGKFTGQDTPACGFSIGFERIVMLLLENGYEVPTVKEKKAYLLEKKMTKEGLLKVMSLAKADRQAGKQVLAVDKDQELVQEIADYVTYAARADVTDSRVFESLGISNMDVVIIGISEDMESSILATLQAKEAGVPLVIAKGMNQMHAKILKKIGADRVVMAEIETGIRLGKNLISGGFQDFFMLSDSFSMVELAVPDSWINHNLEELNLRKKYEINVIAIKKGETICVNIHPEENLCMGEILILAGENKALAKLMKKYKEGDI